MAQKYLHILLGADSYPLDFAVADNALGRLWLERMAARDPYPLDHPGRFYGFDDPATERLRAQEWIQRCCATINSYRPIIEREFEYTQDCLNYLHHIFEQYHGLLDQQQHEFWQSAPEPVRQALAELNLAVHACEAVQRSQNPRFVCTWFGLPKTRTLNYATIANCITCTPAWGSVCLNYVEIGKTLEDLALDGDNYIGDDAFQPFLHYSADFVVRMFEEDEWTVRARIQQMEDYYQHHRHYFQQQGWDFTAELMPYRFPVAHLIETEPRSQIMQHIQQRQHITRVYIDETMHHSHTR